jgi:hypothetical protein
LAPHELTLIKELTIPEWYADVDARIEVCVRFAIYTAVDAATHIKFDPIKLAKQAIEDVLNDD